MSAPGRYSFKRSQSADVRSALLGGLRGRGGLETKVAGIDAARIWPTKLTNASKPDNASSLESVQEIQGALVFRCGSCKAIVGDSYAWYAADKTLNIVVLSEEHEDIAVGDVLETSMQEHDRGSTYWKIECRQCGRLIGRKYLTTPRELDHLREKYSYSVSEIEYYELGQHSRAPANQPRAMTMEEMRVLITKMSSVIIHLEERVTTLETRAAAPNDPRGGGGHGR
ncbi:yippee zinc-binding/DNA-binding /Mis18, centromere assembly-domain-containing protein [Thamnocephalis sphaerospora]|uniref:Yippee zinc-binding/DNA-binding /Mis18, centromere assembly-domain-containing protein n=1 Tax=Thamnocephalis sphaerospora TaxID=78915 RepID=A0A4P9Y0B0_9FUNG|nr:yippee zinc-binding/DNA-binding /Mis18, centromere assembly-domain-containing protein [Thamnocephalis sphaerospora]|eukprot:RKP11200.1 yippee zinc-binding/DNA-binding /Mis18, centromere assembly-domain-containing protein [Thamnocephalis sphaerospora]